MFRSRTIWIGFFLLTALLIGCANAQIASHYFGFDTKYDDQSDIEVLDYRYGSWAAAKQWTSVGRSIPADSVSGPMQVGKELYVKWRVKSTSKIYEQTVDLESRLPPDMNGKMIYFVVRQTQLKVYLIAKGERRDTADPSGPFVYRYYKSIVLFP